MRRSDEAYALDIAVAATAISKYLYGVSKSQFIHNSEKRDAVIRQLSIIGEAASRLSKELRAKHTAVPWKDIMGMRNIVIHQYWEVDFDVVWESAKKDVPALVKELVDFAEKTEKK